MVINIFYQLTSLWNIQITVSTPYSADAAEQAIQYVTDAATQEVEAAPVVADAAPAVVETVTRRLVQGELGSMTNEDAELFCKIVNNEPLYSEDESEEDDDGKAVFEVLCIVIIVFCY